MERWRKKAVQLLPKLQRDILEAKSIGMLWSALWLVFVRAHEGVPDDERIRAVYDFAKWAVEAGDQGPGERCTDEDWATITVCHFYEDLPTEPRVQARIHEFMDREEILGFSEIFRYHLKPEDHEVFMKDVLAARERREKALARQS